MEMTSRKTKKEILQELLDEMNREDYSSVYHEPMDEELSDELFKQSLENRKRVIQENSKKFDGFREIGNTHRYENKPLEATLGEWQESINKIKRKNNGKATKSWNAETF